MSKKITNPDKTNSDIKDIFVRFYFTLAIEHVIPNISKSQSKVEGTKTDEEWFTKYCESLAFTIEENLIDKVDGVIFKRFERHTQENNLFTIYFVISKLHSFSVSDIFYPKKGQEGFKIKVHSLSLAKNEIYTLIYNLLCTQYSIFNISLTFITSRRFYFEIQFCGKLVVERKFTDQEIKDSDGVVSAIEYFNEEMESAIIGFDLTPPTSWRRSRDNRYAFEVTTSRSFSFNENEVVGELTIIDMEMDIDDVRMSGVINLKSAIDSCVLDIRNQLENCLGFELPDNVKLVSFNIDFIDQYDDIDAVCDDLLK